MLVHEGGASVAPVDVHTEGFDPEVMLDRVPIKVVGIVGRDERELVQPLHPVAAAGHPRKLPRTDSRLGERPLT